MLGEATVAVVGPDGQRYLSTFGEERQPRISVEARARELEAELDPTAGLNTFGLVFGCPLSPTWSAARLSEIPNPAHIQ